MREGIMKKTCCIFDIQRFSVHDGPGIRTNVFLKGCQLRCRWCCNPESQSAYPELMFQPQSCIGCGNCVAACTTGAAEQRDGAILFHRERCIGCGACVDGCYADARYVKGTDMSADEVMEEILKDRSFYEESGGGVTFSGGEPLLHAEFVREVMKACKERNIHTAVETCGHAAWESIRKVAAYTDLFLYDIKHMDSGRHRAFTGQGNELIQENIRRLSQLGGSIIIRVPVIPTFNMDTESLAAIIQFAEEIGVRHVNFLPYHRYASGKYALLGRAYWHPGVEKAEVEEVAALARQVTSEKVAITIGG